MIWKDHSELKDFHAFLAPSKHAWLNYDEEKLELVYRKEKAKDKGVRLHALAQGLILDGIRLAKTPSSFNQYVNDAIGYKMKPEVTLFYSPNCFGTADAIGFKDDLLRIHDLKTGVTIASIDQLRIYAALFCLEYHIKPEDIRFELRIYQEGDILLETPAPEIISAIMAKIVRHDRLLNKIKEEL